MLSFNAECISLYLFSMSKKSGDFLNFCKIKRNKFPRNEALGFRLNKYRNKFNIILLY